MTEINQKTADNLQPRPPVVVILGHVDHGKTTLLDYIRKTNLASREAGGITQSVGAYEIEHNNLKLTFIDTPGHEAFTKMRSHGARIADLAILVVSADDGVKPQTAESIKILKESNIPFVVAINKIDKDNADIERTKQDLLSHEVFLEKLGGNIGWQEISAKEGLGIDELLDLIVLTAEMEELKYDPQANASGFILESKLNKQRGNEVLVVIKEGTLKEGQEIIAGSAVGKIKILEDFKGQRSKELSPSSPAIIIGFESLPEVGTQFTAGSVNLAEVKIDQLEDKNNSLPVITENKEGEISLNLIIKSDTSGSLEALSQVIQSLPSADDQVKINIISQGVGEVSDGDIKEALNTHSLIIGFGVKVNKSAENLARARDIEINTSKIIYELVKFVEEKISSLQKEKDKISRLLVLAIFSTSNGKQTIGGRVEEGSIRQGDSFQIKREEEIIGRGKITNLQCQKDDVKEVLEGKECGLTTQLQSDVCIEKDDQIIITRSN